MCNVRIDGPTQWEMKNHIELQRCGNGKKLKWNPFVPMLHPWNDGMSSYPEGDPYPSSCSVLTNRFGGSNEQTFFPDHSGLPTRKYPGVPHHLLPVEIQALHWNRLQQLMHYHCQHNMTRAIPKVHKPVQRPNRAPMRSASNKKKLAIELYPKWNEVRTLGPNKKRTEHHWFCPTISLQYKCPHHVCQEIHRSKILCDRQLLWNVPPFHHAKFQIAKVSQTQMHQAQP